MESRNPPPGGGGVFFDQLACKELCTKYVNSEWSIDFVTFINLWIVNVSILRNHMRLLLQNNSKIQSSAIICAYYCKKNSMCAYYWIIGAYDCNNMRLLLNNRSLLIHNHTRLWLQSYAPIIAIIGAYDCNDMRLWLQWYAPIIAIIGAYDCNHRRLLLQW